MLEKMRYTLREPYSPYIECILHLNITLNCKPIRAGCIKTIVCHNVIVFVYNWFMYTIQYNKKRSIDCFSAFITKRNRCRNVC